MAKTPSPPLLVAADTNVPLDLADEREVVWDAWTTIRARLPGCVLMLPPTVARELAFIAEAGDTPQDRAAARKVFQRHREWGFRLASFIPLGSNLVAQVAERIRAKGMLPPSEVNDSLILAESAALSAAFLLTSDEHLRGIDLQQLTLVLQSFDLRVPVVTTPSEVVRKFFR